ncbi:MAG: ABC transporter permease [Candidatus Thorarchaeota archaeon]
MIDVITAIISGGIVLTAPILFAAIGEIYDERAGVINLGIEATISLGAFVALYVTYVTGSYIGGTLAALAAGAAIALLHSFACVTIGINQLISGLLILTLADGIANFSYSVVYTTAVPIVDPLQEIHIPVLSDIPVLGPILFQHDAFVYLAFLLAIVFGLILYKTTWGLKVRGVGENPEACDAAGINVNLVRHICVILSGVMAGLAGASLTLGYIGIYDQGIAAGRGWIAIIVVIFSRWSPYRAIAGSLIFGMGYSVASNLIGAGVGVSYYFLLTMPYIVALVVIIALVRKTKGPAALTIPYRRK